MTSFKNSDQSENNETIRVRKNGLWNWPKRLDFVQPSPRTLGQTCMIYFHESRYSTNFMSDSVRKDITITKEIIFEIIKRITYEHISLI